MTNPRQARKDLTPLGRGSGGTLKLDDEDDPIRDAIGRSVRAKFRPALVMMMGNDVGARIVVEGNVRIGRDPDSEVCLNDPGVSWEHALIEDRGGSWTLVDLGSTNGSLVNGAKVDERPLGHGDKIRFGKTIFRFEVHDEVDEAYMKAVSELINIDDLTGLFLRRRFDAELLALIDRARAEYTPVGLLAMDLDGVKAINDTHGHLFGAYTISESGKLIGEVIGTDGIACRFGGDEFFAALPGRQLEQTAELGERIRDRISQHRFEKDGVELHPTISIGVAAFPDSAEEATVLFQRADEALYRAKRSGKNCVCR